MCVFRSVPFGLFVSDPLVHAGMRLPRRLCSFLFCFPLTTFTRSAHCIAVLLPLSGAPVLRVCVVYRYSCVLTLRVSGVVFPHLTTRLARKSIMRGFATGDKTPVHKTTPRPTAHTYSSFRCLLIRTRIWRVGFGALCPSPPS